MDLCYHGRVYLDLFRSLDLTVGSICRRRYMKRETRRAIRELSYYSSLGLALALAIFIGLGMGVFLDAHFGTSPWMTLIGLFLGIVAGYRNIGRAIKKIRKL